MAGTKRNSKSATERDPVPEGATKKASDRTVRPGGPRHTPLDDKYAAGTPGGGSAVGGLGGTNIDEGSPRNANLEDIDGSGVAEEALTEDTAGPYAGHAGGAVGGTPAGKRSDGGHVSHGIRPGGIHRGDSTIGSDPDKPTA